MSIQEVRIAMLKKRQEALATGDVFRYQAALELVNALQLLDIGAPTARALPHIQHALKAIQYGSDHYDLKT